MKYIDVHSHLHFSAYDEDRDDVLLRMQEERVGTITVGTSLEHSKEAVELAEKHDNVFASIGVHPNDSVKEPFDEGAFRELVVNEKVVAIGECGLDYYRSDISDEKVKKAKYKEFEKHIAFAEKYKKPLMLHIRPSINSMDAYEDALAILASHPFVIGDTHFFAGTYTIAKKFWERGFMTSFTGVITFADQYNDVVRNAPLNMIMAETDAPYVTPVPFRGKRNEPIFVQQVVERIADIRKEPRERVQIELVKNAEQCFKLPPEAFLQKMV